MKANIRVQDVSSVAISSLETYPINPRRGDIEAIAESLKAHGQYRPIVVQKGTNFILAGNHTYKAAKKLGWRKIKVTFIEADEKTARKIVLADNRLTDIAGYDEPMLKSLLSALPDLIGTGFTQSDIEMLDRLMGGDEKSSISDSKPLLSEPKVKIGAWEFIIESEAYKAWKEQLYSEAPTKQKAIKAIKERLGFPERKPVEKEPVTERSEVNSGDVETVSTKEIQPHPLNPREGDIGAIIESLTHMGQYRPIVVNKQTKHILSGNHTYAAAVQLGWEKVAVHWVDVDNEEELKILIVDNRTSDLASYDSGELNKLLTSVSYEGTGFTREDVADILAGGKSKPGHQPIGRSTIKVGEHSMRVHTEDLNDWANTIYGWRDVVELLAMPMEACSLEENE